MADCGFQRSAFQTDAFQNCLGDDCGFQSDAFQQDAFQMCDPAEAVDEGSLRLLTLMGVGL
jgi:hypothetical protein